MKDQYTSRNIIRAQSESLVRIVRDHTTFEQLPQCVALMPRSTQVPEQHLAQAGGAGHSRFVQELPQDPQKLRLLLMSLTHTPLQHAGFAPVHLYDTVMLDHAFNQRPINIVTHTGGSHESLRKLENISTSAPVLS